MVSGVDRGDFGEKREMWRANGEERVEMYFEDAE
jgi:hypothetical protein